MSLISTTSPDVLKNTGIPIELVLTKADAQGVWEGHPEKVTKTYYVRLTNWDLKLLEDRFESLAKWEGALDTKMVGTLMITLALALRKDGTSWSEQRVSEAIQFGRLMDYRLAVQGAYSMALGRDPKAVKNVLMGLDGEPDPKAAGPGTATTLTATPAASPAPELAGVAANASDSWATTDASPGPTSGPAGWDTATDATTSGTFPSDSGSQPSTPWQ